MEKLIIVISIINIIFIIGIKMFLFIIDLRSNSNNEIIKNDKDLVLSNLDC